MQLRHLQYFLAVAEELSFTRAAERLHMAQPPLSTQIQALESELGVGLFDRSRRAITLTAAGRALIPEARRLLGDVDRVARIVRHAGDGTVGRLAVGLVPSAANGALPEILRRYRRRCPGVELTLFELAPDDLVHQLHERRIDVAFMFAPVADDSLSTARVSTEHLMVALPRSHRLATAPVVDLRALAADPLILPTRHETPGLFSRIRKLLDEVGVEPVVVQREVWMMQTVIGLVAAEIGAAIVPSSAATLHRDGVVYLPLDHAVEPVEMVAVWRSDVGSPTLAGFLDTAGEDTPDIPAPQSPACGPGAVASRGWGEHSQGSEVVHRRKE
jgi:DNA-binding transcriptional LysR family regulator